MSQRNLSTLPTGSRLLATDLVAGLKNGHDAYISFDDFFESVLTLLEAEGAVAMAGVVDLDGNDLEVTACAGSLPRRAGFETIECQVGDTFQRRAVNTVAKAFVRAY